jgi:hypothetical protein
MAKTTPRPRGTSGARAAALFAGALGAAAAFTGCDGCGRKERAEQTTPGQPAGQSAEPAASDPATPALEPELIAGEHGGLLLEATQREGSRAVRLRVANTGGVAVELGAAVVVEVQRGGAFERAGDVGAITLRPSCDATAPRCTTLVPGAELFPPDWLGTFGDAQCACEECFPAPAGTYRVAVLSCDGRRRYVSAPFAVR